MRYKNKLSLAENMALCNLLTAEYKTSKLDDVKFAEYANKVLKLDRITASHIGIRRTALGITSNIKRTGVLDKDSFEKRISDLEFKLNFLCESLNVKFD